MEFAFGYWKTKGEKSFEVLSQWVTKLAQIFQSILEHSSYLLYSKCGTGRRYVLQIVM